MGHLWVQKWSKIFFPNLFLDHLGCSNKCFWSVLSPWWPVRTLQNSQKALKMGFLGTKKGQNWVKNVFFQNDN